ncbi:MAG TPA: cation:proton antiporter [Solirubrobacteraceae bacterium]|nr:cation:proton antiporter [Solirubrobacteraceae bacterium]
MAVISFGTLLVLVLAGLAGPLLGLSGRWFVPVVVGELLAGVLVGPEALGAVHPGGATLSFLGEVGFAMLMLTVGMHLPLRDRRLLSSLRGGALLAVLVGCLSVPGGLLAAALAGTGHAAVYAVVLASGSAAVLLPAFQEARIETPTAIRVMAQVTIADVVTIVTVPIVLAPSRIGHALLGTALVAAAAAALLLAGRQVAGAPWVHRLRERSKRRRWALDLRLSLAVLFLLAWLAEKGGTSVLIAGFGAGVTVAVLGGPKRLSTQVRGVADGFFVPLYFVLLGARLDLSGLFSHSAMLALAGVLLLLNVAIRLLAALAGRMRAAGALAASAQLGVPAAVASLGLTEHALSTVAATAIVASALLSLLTSTIGIDLLSRGEEAQAGAGAGAASTPA